MLYTAGCGDVTRARAENEPPRIERANGRGRGPRLSREGVRGFVLVREVARGTYIGMGYMVGGMRCCILAVSLRFRCGVRFVFLFFFNLELHVVVNVK